MAHYSRILCVIDPTQDEQSALNRAIWLARHSGAELTLLVCYYNEVLVDYRFFESHNLARARVEAVEAQKDKLERMAEPLRKEGLKVSTTAIWAHPLDEGILKQTIALRADVLLKETHYHSALSRAFFTNTDWSLIRQCPVPLWLVKPGEIVDPPKIIAAIDPFHEHDKPATLDDELLQAGQSLASETGGELHAFHSFDPRILATAATVDAFTPTPVSLPEFEQELQDLHQKKLVEVTDRHSIPKDRCHLSTGPTKDELPALARRLDAVLVVMGAVSRGKFDRFIVGSTAERTLSRMPCDLLIIKPNPFVDSAEIDISATG